MTTTTRKRLTPHQAEVFSRLQRYTKMFQSTNGWVEAHHLRCPGAMAHLVEKGYAERRTQLGPRGGEHDSYRPIEAG